MKLSTFIFDNIEPILMEWEIFARTIFAVEYIENTAKLRDHAKKILLAIARDLNQPQTQSEQTAKSQGLQPQNDKYDTAAERHGSGRMEDGFSIIEMVSEYRALRASVTKLFREATTDRIQEDDITDLIRFNEGIDQAITESVASYAFATEQQSRLFETMLSSTPDLTYILDLEGKFSYINSAMVELYQIAPKDILGTSNYNLAMPKLATILEHIEYIVNTGGKCRGEIESQTPTGNLQHFEYSYAPVFDKTGKIVAIAGTSRDVTERKLAEVKIWQSANYDPLTGLVNRRLLQDRLVQTLKHSKRSGKTFALLFIDLDKFKDVNDTLGHHVGDLLLQKISKRIIDCIRETSTISRLGGDEFIVILDEVNNAEQVKLITQRILNRVKKPFLIKKNKVSISASIGITLSPEDGVEPDTLVRNADRAMYDSKRQGGNRFSFYLC